LLLVAAVEEEVKKLAWAFNAFYGKAAILIEGTEGVFYGLFSVKNYNGGILVGFYALNKLRKFVPKNSRTAFGKSSAVSMPFLWICFAKFDTVSGLF
jgi:hypothetical protein